MKAFVGSPVVVDGNSMYPTLHNGEIMMMSKLTAHNSRIFHFQMFLSVLTVLHEIRILTDDVAFYRDSLPHMYAAADGSKKCTFISIVKAGNIP